MSQFEDELRIRGLDWSLELLGHCSSEGHQLSDQLNILLNSTSIPYPLIKDPNPISLRDYLHDYISIHRLGLNPDYPFANSDQNNPHQVVLEDLKVWIEVFHKRMVYTPPDLNEIYTGIDFVHWATYLAFQFLYKIQDQPLRIAGLLSILEAGPLPSMQTCLWFQLASAYLLLDEADQALSYLDHLEGLLSFNDHVFLNSELDFLFARRDFYQNHFQRASDRLYRLLAYRIDDRNLPIYLHFYGMGLILSIPSKKRYQNLIEIVKIVKGVGMDDPMPFFKVLSSMAHREPVYAIPAYPEWLPKRLIEDGVLINSLSQHNLWLRAQHSAPLSLIDLPSILGFDHRLNLEAAQAVLHHLINQNVIHATVSKDKVTFNHPSQVQPLPHNRLILPNLPSPELGSPAVNSSHNDVKPSTKDLNAQSLSNNMMSLGSPAPFRSASPELDHTDPSNGLDIKPPMTPEQGPSDPIYPPSLEPRDRIFDPTPDPEPDKIHPTPRVIDLCSDSENEDQPPALEIQATHGPDASNGDHMPNGTDNAEVQTSEPSRPLGSSVPLPLQTENRTTRPYEAGSNVIRIAKRPRTHLTDSIQWNSLSSLLAHKTQLLDQWRAELDQNSSTYDGSTDSIGTSNTSGPSQIITENHKPIKAVEKYTRWYKSRQISPLPITIHKFIIWASELNHKKLSRYAKDLESGQSSSDVQNFESSSITQHTLWNQLLLHNDRIHLTHRTHTPDYLKIISSSGSEEPPVILNLKEIISPVWVIQRLGNVIANLKYASKGTIIQPEPFLQRLSWTPAWTALSEYHKGISNTTLKPYLEYWSTESVMSLPFSGIKLMIWFQNQKTNINQSTISKYLRLFTHLQSTVNDILIEDGVIKLEEKSTCNIQDDPIWVQWVELRKRQLDEWRNSQVGK